VSASITLVLTTLPTTAAADALTDAVLAARLAACATQLGQSRSAYHWQGAIERAEEVPLLFKTSAARAYELEQFVGAKHPYQTPEILSWSAVSSTAYAAWVDAETSRPLHV